MGITAIGGRYEQWNKQYEDALLAYHAKWNEANAGTRGSETESPVSSTPFEAVLQNRLNNESGSGGFRNDPRHFAIALQDTDMSFTARNLAKSGTMTLHVPSAAAASDAGDSVQPAAAQEHTAATKASSSTPKSKNQELADILIDYIKTQNKNSLESKTLSGLNTDSSLDSSSLLQLLNGEGWDSNQKLTANSLSSLYGVYGSLYKALNSASAISKS